MLYINDHIRNLVVAGLSFLTIGSRLHAQPAPAERNISGIVQDESNRPLAGVFVVNKTNKTAVETKQNGYFQIVVSDGDLLKFSKEGYITAIVNPGRDTLLTVFLKNNFNTLRTINLFSRKDETESSDQQQRNRVINDEILSTTFQDYQKGNTGTRNNSAFLPVYHLKENTQGSAYLFPNWCKGAVLDTAGNIIYRPENFYNYDKINNRLILRMDENYVMQLDFTNVLAFKLSDNIHTCMLEKVPLINPGLYFQKLNTTDGNYEFVKQISTRFEPANFQTNGMISTGHNYDLYTDNFSYFLVNAVKGTYKKIDLKKKTITEYFHDEPLAAEYFRQHGSETVSEQLVADLVNAVNAAMSDK
jgi:hypothetical protein